MFVVRKFEATEDLRDFFHKGDILLETHPISGYVRPIGAPHTGGSIPLEELVKRQMVKQVDTIPFKDTPWGQESKKELIEELTRLRNIRDEAATQVTRVEKELEMLGHNEKSEPCELQWCKSGKDATVRVNENIGDGCFAVTVCEQCQEALNIKPGQDLPEAHEVQDILERVYP